MPGLVSDLVKFLGAAAIGAVATVTAGYFGFVRDNRELDLKMVDVSLAILAGEKGGKEEKDNDAYVLSRTFALNALVKFSGVQMTSEDIQKWARAQSRTGCSRLRLRPGQRLPPATTSSMIRTS